MRNGNFEFPGLVMGIKSKGGISNSPIFADHFMYQVKNGPNIFVRIKGKNRVHSRDFPGGITKPVYVPKGP